MRRTTIAISPNDHRAVLVAALHHREHLSQKEIAERLDMNPMQISRLLAHAHKRGYVSDPTLILPKDDELATELLGRVKNLRDVRVVQTHRQMAETTRIELVATAAAEFWEEFNCTKKRIKIGLSAGRAIAMLVDVVQLPSDYGFDCYSLANIPSGDASVAADTNLALLKRRFSGVIHKSRKPQVTLNLLGALQLSPEMTDAEVAAERKRIMGLERVKRIMREFEESDLVFTGVGSIKDPTLLKLISGLGIEQIPPNVTGTVAYTYVHHSNEPFSKTDTLRSRLVSVSMKALKAIAVRRDTRVAAVAWGASKAKPLLDAYRGGVFNTFIIDSELAGELIRLIDQNYLNPNS